MARRPLTPFGGPDYERNEANCGADAWPCAYCGKACVDPWATAVHVVEGGARFATKEEAEGTVAVDQAGDMGCYPVGPNCAKRLRNAGVHVIDWK